MLRDLILQTAARGTQPASMIGVIDGYDASTHTVKVRFPTEIDDNGAPRLTGWIPIRTAAGGSAAHIVVGPAIGDQCEVGFLEGHPDAPICKGIVHSTASNPPVVQSGEAVIATSSGVTIRIDAGGSITITGGNALAITVPTITITGNIATFGQLTNNGHAVGSTHTHTGVMAGSSTTGSPV